MSLDVTVLKSIDYYILLSKLRPSLMLCFVTQVFRNKYSQSNSVGQNQPILYVE